jgi:integral membrane sensor domain MASE1
VKSSLTSPRWFAWAAVFAAVQAAVVLGTSAAVGPQLDAATWWPSVGTATAIVMMSWSHTPAVVAGMVIAWLVSPDSVASPLPDVALVLAQAVAMRMLVRRALGGAVPRVDTTGDVGVLISSSVMAALGINVAAGLLALLSGRGSLADLAEWLAATGSSGALGAYLIPSMTLAFAARYQSRVPNMTSRVVAAFVVLVVLAGTGFFTPWHWKGATGSLIVIAIPVVIWAAIRLGPRATLVLGIVLAIFATTGTMLGRGALAAPERTLLQRELISNLYVYMATALSLTILATIAERERALRREEETLSTSMISENSKLPLKSFCFNL